MNKTSLLVLPLLFLFFRGVCFSQIVIDTNFPGSNVIFDGVNGDTVKLHPDIRNISGSWFYWYFGVRGSENRRIVFKFTGGTVIETNGPGVSLDSGNTWSWLWNPSASPNEFFYTFPAESGEIRFSMAMPYLEKDFHRFLGDYPGNPALALDTLCTTEQGRSAELLHLGRLDNNARYRILLTCRHHACEMMASFVLEGIIAAVLDTGANAAWFRDNVEFFIVPFVDKDGVENGDQGKNRIPHDHNRDYDAVSLYNTVNAIRTRAPAWAGNRLNVAMDLHCPGICETKIHQVGNEQVFFWEQQKLFGTILDSLSKSGMLVYHQADDVPFGTSWNTSINSPCFHNWASKVFSEAALVTAFEIPYSKIYAQAATPVKLRAFGGDLAGVLRTFMEQECANRVRFTPSGGQYEDSVSVILSAPDSGSVIYFTLDGTPPGPTINRYESPIVLAQSATLSARAYVGDSAGPSVSVFYEILKSSDIIVDNSDSACMNLGGAWTLSTSVSGYYGADYAFANTATGAATALFNPAIPKAGIYEVYLRWTSADSRATAVPMRITYDGGIRDTTVNMQRQGSKWVRLGVFPFLSGGGGSVGLSTTGTTGYVIADAARFSLCDSGAMLSSRPGGVVPAALRVAPNPFNPELQIILSLAEKTCAVVNVYSADGHFVKRLAAGELARGTHSIVWDGRDAAAKKIGTGLYIVSMESTGWRKTVKVLLIK